MDGERQASRPLVGEPADLPLAPSEDSIDAQSDDAPGSGDSESDPDSANASSDGGDKKQRKQRPFWVELPILLVIAFAMTFLIQTFLFKVYYIPSGSMELTLHGVPEGGDRVLVNKIVYDFSDPSPGEVVVFSGPPTWAPEASIPGPTTWYGKVGQAIGSVIGIAPPNEKDFVKRVIATGGQTVQCCDAQGRVEVDGNPLTEPYIYQDFPFTPGVSDCTTTPKSERCFGPVTVPADQLWVMGDHRSQSKDSTYYCRGDQPANRCQGPIPVDNVIGHAIAIVMPVSRWSGIGSPDIQGAAMVGMLLVGRPLRRGTRRWRRH